MKIYIDRENFRKGLENTLREGGVLKKNQQLKKYRVRDLLRDVLNADELQIAYYASRVKLPKGYRPNQKIVDAAEKIKEESRVWLADIVGQNIGLVKAGNLKIKQSKPCYNCHKKQETLQEKGVDVRLSVDMLEDVYDKKLSPVGLFSSDTDLCPVLHTAAAKQIKVVYICFANGLNRAVAAVAHETVAISTDKVKQYFVEKK
jgi:uncharacterized LabA/DUF88 family protein